MPSIDPVAFYQCYNFYVGSIAQEVAVTLADMYQRPLSSEEEIDLNQLVQSMYKFRLRHQTLFDGVTDFIGTVSDSNDFTTPSFLAAKTLDESVTALVNRFGVSTSSIGTTVVEVIRYMANPKQGVKPILTSRDTVVSFARLVHATQPLPGPLRSLVSLSLAKQLAENFESMQISLYHGATMLSNVASARIKAESLKIVVSIVASYYSLPAVPAYILMSLGEYALSKPQFSSAAAFKVYMQMQRLWVTQLVNHFPCDAYDYRATQQLMDCVNADMSAPGAYPHTIELPPVSDNPAVAPVSSSSGRVLTRTNSEIWKKRPGKRTSLAETVSNLFWRTLPGSQTGQGSFPQVPAAAAQYRAQVDEQIKDEQIKLDVFIDHNVLQPWSEEQERYLQALAANSLSLSIPTQPDARIGWSVLNFAVSLIGVASRSVQVSQSATTISNQHKMTNVGGEEVPVLIFDDSIKGTENLWKMYNIPTDHGIFIDDNRVIHSIPQDTLTSIRATFPQYRTAGPTAFTR